jgi:hypothetical protein
MDKKFKLATPVLFLIFNRFEETKRVFEEIKKAKPAQLFIASDGPRQNRAGEKEVVEKIRQYVLSNINWKCNVKTLFREKNLGCKYAVSGAIEWFFKNVEQGIILEDDCLPSQSFFLFCQSMLKKYRNSENIMQISGTNIEGVSKAQHDHLLAPCFNAWGWATWRRAWKQYDVEMKDWKQNRFGIFKHLKKYSLFNKIKTFRLYELTYQNKINTWDYQWIYKCINKDGLCVIPQKNLILNIGFKGGTHTINYNKNYMRQRLFNLKLKESASYNADKNNDYIISYLKFFEPSILKRIQFFFKNLFI